MPNRLTELNLCNQALRNFGQGPVTSLAVTNDARVTTWNEHFITTRDELLESHFWNFATVRTTLTSYRFPTATLTPAAVTGTGILFTTSTVGVFGLNAVGQTLSGFGVAGAATITALVTTSPAAILTPAAGALTPEQTGVVFTASAAVLAAGDVGKLIENLAGVGVARITAFTDTTHVVATIETAWLAVTAMAATTWQLVATDQVTATITSDFAAITPIPSGSWRLNNAAPEWGFGFRLTLPTDYLRPQRIRWGTVYQREGEYLVCGSEAVALTYTQRVTDITRWPAYFVAAVVATMTSKLTEPGTGQRAKQVDWVQMAERKLARAKLLDGMEGSPPIMRAHDLAMARFGGGHVTTTEESTTRDE